MGADSARSGTDFNPTTELNISEDILVDMHAHASSTYPEECCGLLLGKVRGPTKTATESRRMGNVFVKEERYHRYTIDPKEFLNAESDAEARGLEVVGIYHSHPNAPAKPSRFDTDYGWPTLSYVVIEERDARPVETNSWILKDDRSEFVQEKLAISK